MSAKVDGHRTINGLRRLSAGIHLAAQRTVASAVLAAEQSAKTTTLFHDQSGETRRSIKGSVWLNSGKVVARGAAMVLENGTKAHDIVSRNGGRLRFYVNGQAVFRRSVRHPGTSARPFMAQALFHAEHVVNYAAQIYVNEAIARA